MRAALDTNLLLDAEGFSWRGVRVVNPLMEPLDSLLLQLLA
jgi:hypothetical protein